MTFRSPAFLPQPPPPRGVAAQPPLPRLPPAASTTTTTPPKPPRAAPRRPAPRTRRSRCPVRERPKPRPKDGQTDRQTGGRRTAHGMPGSAAFIGRPSFPPPPRPRPLASTPTPLQKCAAASFEYTTIFFTFYFSPIIFASNSTRSFAMSVLRKRWSIIRA